MKYIYASIMYIENITLGEAESQKTTYYDFTWKKCSEYTTVDIESRLLDAWECVQWGRMVSDCFEY